MRFDIASGYPQSSERMFARGDISERVTLFLCAAEECAARAVPVTTIARYCRVTADEVAETLTLLRDAGVLLVDARLHREMFDEPIEILVNWQKVFDEFAWDGG